MKRIGLVNTVIEPFMDYGVSWDNEYVSLHLLDPDYQPMVAYPIAHTPSTDGKQELRVVIADVHTRQDLAKFRGRLRGLAVLSTPPASIDLTRFATGVPRRTDEELRQLAEAVVPPRRRPDDFFSRLYPDPPQNPDVLTAAERLAFYVAEGVAVVLESRSGWPGAVRGFARLMGIFWPSTRRLGGRSRASATTGGSTSGPRFHVAGEAPPTTRVIRGSA